MKRYFYSLLVMLSIISITISSCKKDSQDNDTKDLTSVEESAVAGETFSESFTDVSTLSVENDGLFMGTESGFQVMGIPEAFSNSCAVVTILPKDNTWPKTLTVNFGEGCTVENITRKGKIIAVFSDRFKNPGAKITVTFENFYVNDHKIEGTKIITNKGKNEAGNLYFTVEVSKSKITTTGKVFSFSSLNTIEWKEGFASRTHMDDVFSITGSASGTNSKGKEFTITIVKPFIKKVACRFIISGSADIKSGTLPIRTLDYGNGDCDNKATVTVLGVVKEITLRK